MADKSHRTIALHENEVAMAWNDWEKVSNYATHTHKKTHSVFSHSQFVQIGYNEEERRIYPGQICERVEKEISDF